MSERFVHADGWYVAYRHTSNDPRERNRVHVRKVAAWFVYGDDTRDTYACPMLGALDEGIGRQDPEFRDHGTLDPLPRFVDVLNRWFSPSFETEYHARQMSAAVKLAAQATGRSDIEVVGDEESVWAWNLQQKDGEAAKVS